MVHTSPRQNKLDAGEGEGRGRAEQGGGDSEREGERGHQRRMGERAAATRHHNAIAFLTRRWEEPFGHDSLTAAWACERGGFPRHPLMLLLGRGGCVCRGAFTKTYPPAFPICAKAAVRQRGLARTGLPRCTRRLAGLEAICR